MAPLVPPSSALRYSIIAAIAGVELHPLEIGGDALDGLVAQAQVLVVGRARARASHSSTRRQTRFTKRFTPSMARGSQGLASSNSPMNIS